MTVFVLSGNPGTGKTSVGLKLAENGIILINLFEKALEYNCEVDNDEERDTLIIDIDCLRTKLMEYGNKKNQIYIFEGHYGDAVPREIVSKCFVLEIPISELIKRYQDRGYNQQKMDENIEAAIMQECLYDCIEYYGETKVELIHHKDLSLTTSKILNIIRDSKNV